MSFNSLHIKRRRANNTEAGDLRFT